MRGIISFRKEAIKHFLLLLVFLLSPFLVTSRAFATESPATDSLNCVLAKEESEPKQVRDCVFESRNLLGLNFSHIDFYEITHRTGHLEPRSEVMGVTANITSDAANMVSFVMHVQYLNENGEEIISTEMRHAAPPSREVTIVQAFDVEYLEMLLSGQGIKIEDFKPASINIRISNVAGFEPREKAECQGESCSSDHTYDSYSVDLKVAEDQAIFAHETMKANFLQPRHGIIRHIPKVFKTDTYGERDTRVEIMDSSVPYSTQESRSYIDVRMGSADQTIIGPAEFELTYKYEIGDDNYKKGDEFYYNLVRDESPIANFGFSIQMPKSFPLAGVGFNDGIERSRPGDNAVLFFIEDDTIYGFYDGFLNGNALTVRIALPEGYFSPHKISGSNSILPQMRGEQPGVLAMLGGCILVSCLAAIAYFLWNKYGRDKEYSAPVEFYPPDRLNSLDTQFYYKGSVDSKGVVSLLFYLAEKGYLQIISKSNGRKASFKKLKDYDGKNEAERLFMEGLFKKGDTVRQSDLSDSFYRTISKISQIYSGPRARSFIYKNNGFTKAMTVLLSIIASIVIIVIVGANLAPSRVGVVPSLILTSILLQFLGIFRLVLSKGGERIWSRAFVNSIVLYLSFILPACFVNKLVGGPFWIGPQKPINIVILAVTFFAYALILACNKEMRKRNEYGGVMKARVSGFKNFLETAEKSRLEKLVMENPSYFSDILPYTYALGVSNTWVEQFMDIAHQPPEWYVDSKGGDFNAKSFEVFIDRGIGNVFSDMTYSSASDSDFSGSSGGGGGSSSGGSSGGGGGGGGSSSW